MTIRSRIVLTLSLLAAFTAACDTDPATILVGSAASSFTAGATFSTTPIRLTPLVGTRCAGGAAFGTSFHLLITTGVRDLKMDSATFQLIDGTHVGGPSVTIPSLAFATQPTLLFIPAGTTRDFGLHADFGCFAGRPFLMRGNVFLFDPFGSRHSFTLESRIE
jgi:hypothetical protein